MMLATSLGLWIGFNLFILAMILIDLFLLHRDPKAISMKQSLVSSIIWIGVALLFNYGIYLYQGKEAALNFFAGYLIEKSLSVDNLFIFLTLFQYFHTPLEYQHKVLFWGILGAIIMRAFFIIFGIALVNQFHWILYLFGIFLLYAAIKMIFPDRREKDLENNFLIKQLKKWMPVSSSYHNGHFFVHLSGSWWATPLFVVLLLIEATDLVFALDSIPAIMAITLDPFIVYTSNIFAILGLRSLYFLLAGLIGYFHFLNYGLAAILMFVGLKMLVEPWIHIPITATLAFIVIALGLSMLASVLHIKKHHN